MSGHLNCTVTGYINNRVYALVADYRKLQQNCHDIDLRVGISKAKGDYA